MRRILQFCCKRIGIQVYCSYSIVRWDGQGRGGAPQVAKLAARRQSICVAAGASDSAHHDDNCMHQGHVPLDKIERRVKFGQVSYVLAQQGTPHLVSHSHTQTNAHAIKSTIPCTPTRRAPIHTCHCHKSSSVHRNCTLLGRSHIGSLQAKQLQQSMLAIEHIMLHSSLGLLRDRAPSPIARCSHPPQQWHSQLRAQPANTLRC